MAGARVAGRGNPISPRPAWRRSHLGILLLVLSATFFGVNFSQEWLMSHQMQQNAAALQAHIAAQEALNAQLQNKIAYYSSKDYIVTEARLLGMARPGDTLMLVKPQPATLRTVRVRVPAAAPAESVFIRLLRAILQ